MRCMATAWRRISLATSGEFFSGDVWRVFSPDVARHYRQAVWRVYSPYCLASFFAIYRQTCSPSIAILARAPHFERVSWPPAAFPGLEHRYMSSAYLYIQSRARQRSSDFFATWLICPVSISLISEWNAVWISRDILDLSCLMYMIAVYSSRFMQRVSHELPIRSCTRMHRRMRHNSYRAFVPGSYNGIELCSNSK